MKNKILVSFSGGKTSAMMCSLMLADKTPEDDLVFVFANTGQEREETLEFVDACDKHFGLNLVWVEADVYHGERKGTAFKTVSFETASRAGEPFEEVIKKYGIPNQAYPHCTRELKLAPIHAYVKSIGWTDYLTAIGIREDEQRRIKDKPEFIYPMNEKGIDKVDVNVFWEEMPFNLQLKEHEGNCSWCWKKSDKKIMMLIKSHKEIFDFPRRMEASYGLNGANVDGTHRKFFRRHRSTDDMFTEYEVIASSQALQIDFIDDMDSGCSESCEPFFQD